MQHHNGRSRTAVRRSVATAVTVALGAGLVTAVAPAATAATTPQAGTAGEAVLPPQNPVLPDQIILQEAGRTGYSASLPGSNSRFWTDFATGATRSIGNQLGHSGLSAVQTKAPDGTWAVAVTDHATGERTLHSLPEGAFYAQMFTHDAIVVYRRGPEQYIDSMSILRRAADGTTEEIPVTGVPANSRYLGYPGPVQTGFGAVFGISSGTPAKWHLDFTTARLTRLPEAGPGGYRLGRHQVITAYDHVTQKVTTFDTRTPDAAPVVTTLPAPEHFEGYYAKLAVVGDTILANREGSSSRARTHPGTKLLAVPIGNTGEPRELQRYATGPLAPAPDGSVLFTGGSGPKDWAVRRVAPAADGTPEVTVVRAIPKTVADIEGLAIGGGRLSYVVHTDGAPLRAVYSHDISGTDDAGTPVVGARQAPSTMLSPISGELHSLGDGRSAFSGQGGYQVLEPGSHASAYTSRRPPSLSEASGRYLIMTDGDSPYRQYIKDVRAWSSGVDAHTRSTTAASVWGSTLWTPGKAAGSVVAYDLKSKKSQPELKLGSGCVPNDLQAVGRWLYWACGTTEAGVYDLTAARNTSVAAGGRTKLGDGFVVRESGGELELTNLHTGTTTPVATLPANAKWAVDKFGGHLAYVDAGQAIRVRTVDVPRSPLTVVESEGDSSRTHYEPSYRRWDGRWQLSRPATSWSVTIKDAAGTVVRTLAQGSVQQTGARLTAAWDTKDADGRAVRNGTYRATLTIEGQEASSEWVTVSGGPDVPRDYNADGIPEVVTRLGADLTAHQGLVKTATGGTVQRTSKGWKDITAVLPMGDMNNQGCDDLVVRNTKGELWRHEGTCAGLPGPTSVRVRIGTGFAAFDTILPAGDLTGDGHGDLLARKPDGKLFVYAVTPTGTLRSAGTPSGSFKGLTLIAPGDLTGDGHGDLLARDAGGELWRYNGTGKGTLGAKTLLYKDWALTRKVFAGAGDLNGDGRADLLSRDTAGRLWQNLATEAGTLGASTQVGTGWQRYTSLH
ncbi:FG-GAP-like repeat-containing protein [Streptomyces sp. NPDC003691]